MNLTDIHEHVCHIAMALSHSDDSTAAHLESDPLQHPDILDPLLISMRAADIRIKGTARVQIVIDPVQAGILEQLCLLFRQKSD